MKECSKFVGLDTHQDTIAVAVSDAGGGEARYYGTIPNQPKAIAKLVKPLTAQGEKVAFCYEAGPCGYGRYRHLRSWARPAPWWSPRCSPRNPATE